MSLVTIKSLTSQVESLNLIIKNYNVPKSELDRLTTFATSQISLQDYQKLRSENTTMANQIKLLQSQLNEASGSSQYVKVVNKLQLINATMNLSIVELDQLPQYGLQLLDDYTVRTTILKKVKSTLIGFYGDFSVDMSKIKIPQEETAFTASSEFFLYYIYTFLNNLYEVFSFFKF